MKTNDAFHGNSLNAAGSVVLPDQTSPAPQIQDYADAPLLVRHPALFQTSSTKPRQVGPAIRPANQEGGELPFLTLAATIYR